MNRENKSRNRSCALRSLAFVQKSFFLCHELDVIDLKKCKRQVFGHEFRLSKTKSDKEKQLKLSTFLYKVS